MPMTLADPNFASTKSRADRAPLSEAEQVTRILLTVLVALAAWGMAIFTWGIPGLYIPALAMVPVIWVCLIAITMGK